MQRHIVALLATTGLTLVASMGSSALAADMPMLVKAPPMMVAPAPSWTGWYVGGTVGGAWGSSDPNTSTVFTPPSYFVATSAAAVNAAGPQHISSTGFTGGIELGYNWQVSNFVLGVEADFESLGLSGSANTAGFYPLFPAGKFNVASSMSTDWMATIRGRLGLIAWNNWLLYGTAGVAFTNEKATWGFSDNCGAVAGCNGPGAPNAVEAATASQTKTGWTAGGGVESKLNERWSWKVEYLYASFGGVNGAGFINPATLTFFGLPTTTNPFSHSTSLNTNIVRFGLNYKL